MDHHLLTVQNAKTQKGEPLGYLTGILYLVPSDGSKLGNLCPYASTGCRHACLYTAGRGRMEKVKNGRLRKTKLFFEDSARFADALVHEIATLTLKAYRRGMMPAIRLNGTSDIPWERIKASNEYPLMAMFPHVQFYDYTKRPDRKPLFPNYHLTFSRSECNDEQVMKELANGRNVAIVFDTKRGLPLPPRWNSWPVLDGDTHDLRFLDAPYHVVGLRAKGDAKSDTSGFVVIGGS